MLFKMEVFDDSLWVCLLGYKGVGKRTILRSFCEEHFRDVSYALQTQKILNYKGGRVKLILHANDWADYFPIFSEDNVVCLVYNITDKNTFQRIRKIEQHLEQRYSSNWSKTRTKILLANKIDLHARRTVSREEGQSFAQSIGATYFEVEAKSSSSVENVMRMIVILRKSEEERLQGKPGQYQIKGNSYGISPTLLKVLKSSPTTFSDILTHGTEENYQIRVMVVGNGGVGKTTLTRRLLHFPVNLKRYDSTNGIDVHIHSCAIDLDTSEWVPMEKYSVYGRVKYWLLGETEETKATKNAESIIFWLNIIYMFAAVKSETHPHVILVGTHVDKIPKENRETIAENFFKEFRSAIAEMPFNAILSETEFIVDNSRKNDKSYSRLKTEIFELAKLQSSWGEKTPAKWLPLDREIQQRKESGFKVLTLEELKTINRGLEINISNDTEMDAFLSFLHQSGEAIYYSDKFLRDNIVLDPVWLIGGLKAVITADKFAIRSQTLATQWKEFCESGVICRSAIVRIFEKNKEDPSLFKNHEHVIRLMEKFLFIAAPVDEHGDFDGNGEEAEKDVRYIIPCMVRKEADKNLLTNLEGSSRTTIFCMVAENHFLPPAIFQKLLAMCITKWPIVEQNGRKLIFCGVCKFNLDKANHYKLTLFLVNYAVHARIDSFMDKEQPHHAVCQPVQEFLTQSLRSIFEAMGLSDEFCQCIQCPQYSPIDSGGYLNISDMLNQAAVTCDKCQKSHLLNVQELLGGWIDMKQDKTEPTGIAVGGCASQEKVPVPDMEEIDVGGCAGPVKVPVPDMEEINAEAPMTKQHINHARLCNVLVTVCADGLRDILLSQVPPGFADFYAALLANEPKLTAMRQLRHEQKDLLFPDPNGQFTGKLDQFDITLLYFLIRNISFVPAPVKGWGTSPVDQPRDTSLSANVERIRIYRNHVNGHSADGRLEDRIFEDYWDEISAVMDDIENSIGPKGYHAELEKRKDQVFTPKEAQKLQLKLKELEEANKNLKKDMEYIIRKLQPIVEKYAY